MYNILSLLNIIFGYFCGRKASFDDVGSDARYWRIMLLPIVLFIITYGLRDGWLPDFTLYKEAMYERMNAYEDGRLGWCLELMFKYGSEYGVHYNVIIALTCGIVIIGYCWIIKSYREYANWILPIFYCISFMCCQYIAFFPASILMLMFFHYHLNLDNKWKVWEYNKQQILILLSLCLLAFGFHKAILVCILFYVIALSFDFKPIFVIVLYALSFVFVQEWWISILKSISFFIQLEDSSSFGYLSVYTSGAEDFYGSDDHEMKADESSLLHHVAFFISNSAAIWLYYKYRVKNKIDNSKDKILELASIGIILTNMTTGVEVVSRFALVFRLYIPILYAVSISYALYNKRFIDLLLACSIIVFQGYFFFVSFYKRDISEFFYLWN